MEYIIINYNFMEWEEGFLLSRIILACSARQVHYWKQSLALTTRAEEETLSIALMASPLRPWSNLPDEILVMLFKRLLHICDRIRFRAVCKGWRLPVRLIQGLFPIPKLPWTMEYMWKKTTDSTVHRVFASYVSLISIKAAAHPDLTL